MTSRERAAAALREISSDIVPAQGECLLVPSMREACPSFRRNYILGLANGTAFRFADTMIDPSVVTAWFVGLLTSSPVLLGLLMPIYKGGWFLLQLPTSHHVQQQTRHMPTYIFAAVIRVLSWAALAPAVFFLAGQNDQLLLWLFFGFWTLASLAGGVGAVPLLSIIGRCIPAGWLGRFFGYRDFFGGIVGVTAGIAVERILAADMLLPFPVNYALIFGVAAFVLAITFTLFALIEEPDEPVPDDAGVSFGRYLADSLRVFADDRPFTIYTAAPALLITVELAVPFYTAYAQKTLLAPAHFVGIYVTAMMAASIASNILWGQVSKRQGNKQVLIVAALMGLVAPLGALLLHFFASSAPGPTLHYLFTIIFMVAGAARIGVWVGGNSYLLEYSPELDRPRYVGLANSGIGVAMLLGIGMGIAVDRIGLVPFFWGAALMTLAGLFFCFRLAVPSGPEAGRAA